MRALNYKKHGGINNLQISKHSIPPVSGNEILIRVFASSINPFDWKLRSGALKNFFDVDFPVIPGRDGCGEIVAMGKTAKQQCGAELQPGKRVVFISSNIQQGAMAEFAVVKDPDYIASAPPNLTNIQCAALPLGGLSAWNAIVETAKVKERMKVLIHGGSGGVGSIAIQIARYLNAEVFATCSFANLKSVEELGATGIPYDRLDFTESVSDCDVVLDTIGGKVHEKSYTVLKNGGQLVYLIANPFRDLSHNFDVETRQVVTLDSTRNLRPLMDFATKGAIRPRVSNALPLTDFKEAFQLAETGKSSGKIVIVIQD